MDLGARVAQQLGAAMPNASLWYQGGFGTGLDWLKMPYQPMTVDQPPSATKGVVLRIRVIMRFTSSIESERIQKLSGKSKRRWKADRYASTQMMRLQLADSKSVPSCSSTVRGGASGCVTWSRLWSSNSLHASLASEGMMFEASPSRLREASCEALALRIKSGQSTSCFACR